MAEFEWVERPEPSHFEVFDSGYSGTRAVRKRAPSLVGRTRRARSAACVARSHSTRPAPLSTGHLLPAGPRRRRRAFRVLTGAEIETDRPVADVEVQAAIHGPGLGAQIGSRDPRTSRDTRAPCLDHGVTAVVEWKGPKGFTAWAKCTATLVDQDGRTVWQDYEWILDRPCRRITTTLRDQGHGVRGRSRRTSGRPGRVRVRNVLALNAGAEYRGLARHVAAAPGAADRRSSGDDYHPFRTCPLCEATCVLTISMNGGISEVRGDPDDVFSRGYICPKGTAVKHLQRTPTGSARRSCAPARSCARRRGTDAFKALERVSVR